MMQQALVEARFEGVANDVDDLLTPDEFLERLKGRLHAFAADYRRRRLVDPEGTPRAMSEAEWIDYLNVSDWLQASEFDPPAPPDLPASLS